jgi:hypothetical protein
MMGPKGSPAHQDAAKRFAAECVMAECAGFMRGADVYYNYLRWAAEHGAPLMSNVAFGHAASAMMRKRRTEKGSMYPGAPRDPSWWREVPVRDGKPVKPGVLWAAALEAREKKKRAAARAANVADTRAGNPGDPPVDGTREESGGADGT